MKALSLCICSLAFAMGCSPTEAQLTDSISVGDNVDVVKMTLSKWGASSASEKIAWAHGIPSASASEEEVEAFRNQQRLENDLYDDPIYRWIAPTGECTACFTAKRGVLTEITLIKHKNDWQRGVSSICRDGTAR